MHAAAVRGGDGMLRQRLRLRKITRVAGSDRQMNRCQRTERLAGAADDHDLYDEEEEKCNRDIRQMI